MKNIVISRFLVLILSGCLSSTLFSRQPEKAGNYSDQGMMDYAVSLLERNGKKNVKFLIDSTINHPEAFRILKDKRGITIYSATSAGWIYGAMEVADGTCKPGRIEKPCLDIRGTTLWIEGAVSGKRIVPYASEFNAEKFPWFFDRNFMIRYLDVIAAARYNTIFVWASHPFPNILELPAYPDASGLSHDELMQNQEQFRWFTGECGKRNIRVMLHFYNIHLPAGLKEVFRAEPSWGASAVTRPTPEVAEYYRYILSRYFKEFSNAGLYICPGETLGSAYQLEWFRDVIFETARASGKNPLLIIRDWTMNMEFRSEIKTLYENSYSELKHNDESFTSPVPDLRHARWKGVLPGHIVNLHGPPMDLEPMRWGSPVLIKETVSEWLKLGYVKGAEIYALSCFDWPVTQDKLEPGQYGYREQVIGPTLLSIDRDRIFFDAFGRYLWNNDRNDKQERKYWEKYLGNKFGSEKAGRSLYQWYVLTGPVSPGMQNLTAVKFGNFWSTTMLQNQGVDDILAARQGIDDVPVTLSREAGRTGQVYYSRPVDNYFFRYYKERYNADDLTQRITMPVARYAAELDSGMTVFNAMTPDKVCDLLCTLAAESLIKARTAREAVHVPELREELDRFVTDSRMYMLATEALRHKVQAAILKARILNGNRTGLAELFISHMEASVRVYEELASLTGRTYRNANDLMGRHWKDEGLEEFRKDLAGQLAWIRALTK